MRAKFFGFSSVCSLILIVAACGIFPGLARAEDSSEDAIAHARMLSSAFEDIARRITPSVVNISAVKKAPKERPNRRAPDPFFDQFRDFFGDDFFERFGPNGDPERSQPRGLGTGVIVDDKGHILTNNHVVGDADDFTIRLSNDKMVKAEVVGKDPRTDLAVLKVKVDGLTPAKLGDSDALKIGEWVIAAGNPFGLDNTITAGIVSAKGRSIMGGGQYEDFIQTDAAINPGNSGGPLVNINGEVVGINTAIFSRSGGYMGIGFAIPINMAKDVFKSLITKGKVVRGWLGVGIQNLTEDLAQSFNFPGTEGALVGHVEKDGPADKAGLKQGDIITRLGETKIKNINQLRNLVAGIEPGSSIEAEYIREGRTKTVTIKIGELPAQTSAEVEEEGSPSVDLGINVETLTEELARRLGSKARSGVVVRSVRPGGIGEQGGIQARDIILSVNGAKISNVNEFMEAIESADLERGIRLVVESQGMERFVFLRSMN